MKIKALAANQTELYDNTGTVVLFSYETPVAAILPSGRPVRTSEKYSQTTTKHINKWLQAFTNVDTVEQSFIDNLVGA